MTIGPGFEIKNCTQWPMTVSLEQIGPLYYGLVQPGAVLIRDTGAVWFTIRAVISLDNVCHVDDWDCILPVGVIVGTVVFAALTGGSGVFTAIAQSVGATAAVSEAAGISLANVVIARAGIGLDAFLTLSNYTKVLGDLFGKNGGVTEWGCYAGPPWPFRTDRKQYSIVGGTVASATNDGKLLLSEGDALRIVEGFQAMPANPPLSHNWLKMPGALTQMSMIRSGLMMGVNARKQPMSWDGHAWTVVIGDRIHISAAADGTVWSVNTQKRLYKWVGSDWVKHEMSDYVVKCAVGGSRDIWFLDNRNRIFRITDESVAPTLIPGSLIDISVASDGSVWGVGGAPGTASSAYKWNGSGWDQMPGTGNLAKVAVGSAAMVWGVTWDNGVVRWNGSAWVAVNVPEPFAQVTVSSDGAVCGIAQSQNVYMFNKGW